MTDEEPLEEEPLTDEELLIMLRAGWDEEAVYELRARYHKRLIAYTYGQFFKHKYEGPTTADEVVNDVWADFWARPPATIKKTVASYLFSMVFNKVRRLSEGRKFEPLTEEIVDDEDLDDALIREEEHAEVKELADAINEDPYLREDTAFVRMNEAGYPHKSIARFIGKSANYVGVRIFNARKKLREAIEKRRKS